MIDVKEAIIRLKKGFLVDCKGDTTNKDFEALNAAIKALEKQIPKKPKIKMLGQDITYWCPNCKEEHIVMDSKKGFKYCHHCGQKLNWSCEE